MKLVYESVIPAGTLVGYSDLIELGEYSRLFAAIDPCINEEFFLGAWGFLDLYGSAQRVIDVGHYQSVACGVYIGIAGKYGFPAAYDKGGSPKVTNFLMCPESKLLNSEPYGLSMATCIVNPLQGAEEWWRWLEKSGEVSNDPQFWQQPGPLSGAAIFRWHRDYSMNRVPGKPKPAKKTVLRVWGM